MQIRLWEMRTAKGLTLMELSYWNVNNPATNVNTNIVASQSYQIMEHLTKSTPFSYTAGC